MYDDADYEDWAMSVWAAVEYRGTKAGIEAIKRVLDEVVEEGD